MRTEQYERTDGIGAPPGKCLAVLRIQGFGYEQEPIEPVGKTQSSCHPKGHSRIAVADNATHHRTQRESDPKCSADETDRHHVEHDGDENEYDCGSAISHCTRSFNATL